MSAKSHESLPEQLPPRPESLREQLPVVELENENIALDGEMPTLYDPAEIGLPRTGYYAVVGELRLGRKHGLTAAIVRERRGGNDAFHMFGLSSDEDGKMTLTGEEVVLTQGATVIIGRDHSNAYLWENDDAYVSRSHARVTLFGNRIFIEDTSTNGTRVAGVEKHGQAYGEDKPDHHRDDYTSRADNELFLLRNDAVKEANGESYIQGRVTIGRDTEINADRPAIDIRSWDAGGESIVVDSKKYPEEYAKLMARYEKQLKHWSMRKHGMTSEERKLRAIYDAVSATLNYNLDYVNAWEEIVSKKPKESMRKVGLDVYLKAGEGVCRHMALAVAWLGGELARKGELSGKTTAGANYRDHDNAGHEWARYTAADGTVYIIDPAQHHFGKLADYIDDKKVWEYFRPGEREKYQALAGEGKIDPAHVVFGAGRIVRRFWK